jgi:hypothetical protein
MAGKVRFDRRTRFTVLPAFSTKNPAGNQHFHGQQNHDRYQKQANSRCTELKNEPCHPYGHKKHEKCPEHNSSPPHIHYVSSARQKMSKFGLMEENPSGFLFISMVFGQFLIALVILTGLGDFPIAAGQSSGPALPGLARVSHHFFCNLCGLRGAPYR